MGFTPRKPFRPQTNVSRSKPVLSADKSERDRLKKELESRWSFQTSDKSAGKYSVPEIKAQLGIDGGEWKNITDDVCPLI
jgi:hypothetical protein